MTWRTMTYTLLLLVFIAAIELTKGDIKEYFDLDSSKEDLTQPISLRKPKDPKDIIACTVERECVTRGKLCHLFHHVFSDQERDEDPKNISEKCQGEDFKNISFYNFMCLAAKAKNLTGEGCHDYETVCMLYSENPSNLCNRKASTTTTTTTLLRTTTATATKLPGTTTTTATTTKSPRTTTSLRTKAATATKLPRTITTATTTKSPRTTTAATTKSPRTTTAATLLRTTTATQLTTKSETTALSLTTKETIDKGVPVRAQSVDSNAESLRWKIACIVSLFVNGVFVVLVARICLQRRRDRSHSTNSLFDGEAQSLQPLQPSNSGSVEMIQM